MGERIHRLLEDAEEKARLAIVHAASLAENEYASPGDVRHAILKAEEANNRVLVLRRIADRD